MKREERREEGQKHRTQGRRAKMIGHTLNRFNNGRVPLRCLSLSPVSLRAHAQTPFSLFASCQVISTRDTKGTGRSSTYACCCCFLVLPSLYPLSFRPPAFPSLNSLPHFSLPSHIPLPPFAQKAPIHCSRSRSPSKPTSAQNHVLSPHRPCNSRRPMVNPVSTRVPVTRSVPRAISRVLRLWIRKVNPGERDSLLRRSR